MLQCDSRGLSSEGREICIFVICKYYKDLWIYKISRFATQASFPAKYLTGIPEKRWLVLFLFFFSYHFSSKVLLRVWIIYSLVLLLLSVWYWRYELFCIQLKSSYQLAGHDIISEPFIVRKSFSLLDDISHYNFDNFPNTE